MSRPVRIEWGAASEVGSVRTVNEDSYLALPDRGAWVVADGMGGFDGGDWASARLTGLIAASPRGGSFDEFVSHCAEAIHAANDAIWAEAQARGAQMGTTVVALLIGDGRFAILWAGDSRAYLLRDDVLYPLTRDHSQVQALVDRGLLAPEDAADHPMSHVLARAIGVEPTLMLDVVTDDVRPDDLFLLTSDGVHGVVPAADMARIAGQNALAAVPDALVAAGLANGSRDNLTAITVGVSEATMLALSPQGGEGA